jgi:hypothetical protein
MRSIDDVSVTAALPPDRVPARWEAFVAAARAQPEPWFAIQHADPGSLHHLPMRAEVRDTVVPFLGLGDGGIVALWLRADDAPVVFIGSDGEREGVAPDFDSFLARLAGRCTGLPHLDELPPPDEVPEPPPAFAVTGVAAASAADPVEKAALDAAFAAYFSSMELTPVTHDAAAERALYDAAMAAGTRAVHAGELPGYDEESPWWEVEVHFERGAEGWSARLAAPPRALAADHPLAALARFLDAVRGPDAGPTAHVAIVSGGVVTIDGGKELVGDPD